MHDFAGHIIAERPIARKNEISCVSFSKNSSHVIITTSSRKNGAFIRILNSHDLTDFSLPKKVACKVRFILLVNDRFITADYEGEIIL